MFSSAVSIVTTLELTVADLILNGNKSLVLSPANGNRILSPATVNGADIFSIPFLTCHSPLRSSLPLILELRNPGAN